MFGTGTLRRPHEPSRATRPTTPGPFATEKALSVLEALRDGLANTIKTELMAAEFNGAPISSPLAAVQTAQADALLGAAEFLAAL